MKLNLKMASISFHSPSIRFDLNHRASREHLHLRFLLVKSSSTPKTKSSDAVRVSVIQCSLNKDQKISRTCKNCKSQFDPLLNNPNSCRFHSSHFGGETKRKFESVHSGGTMSTPESGKVYQYWHCCGSEDPFHPGCTASPHASYDE